jgi:hypothetical protein
VLHDLLFVATDLGLFHSTNGGASWAPVAGVPLNVCIDQLVWKNDRELLCVTHGRVRSMSRECRWPEPRSSAPACGHGHASSARGPRSPVVGTTMQFSLAAALANAPCVPGTQHGPAELPCRLGSCTIHVDLLTAFIDYAGMTSGTGAWRRPAGPCRRSHT